MNISGMELSVAEKMAIVRAIEAVMMADGTVHPGEVKAFSHLMHQLELDSNCLVQSRHISLKMAKEVFKGLCSEKKELLARLMEDMARSDGHVHEKEIKLILSVFHSAGIRVPENRAI